VLLLVPSPSMKSNASVPRCPAKAAVSSVT
jgi:hypothetical protein